MNKVNPAFSHYERSIFRMGRKGSGTGGVVPCGIVNVLFHLRLHLESDMSIKNFFLDKILALV